MLIGAPSAVCSIAISIARLAVRGVSSVGSGASDTCFQSFHCLGNHLLDADSENAPVCDQNVVPSTSAVSRLATTLVGPAVLQWWRLVILLT